MEKTSVVKKFYPVNQTIGKKKGDILYYHLIDMENGDYGKIQQCQEKNPIWLQPGATLSYRATPGRFPDNDGRMRESFYRILNTQQSNNDMYMNDTHNIPQEAAKKSSWTSRLDSDPAFRLRQQKCISLTTCLDRANELVIAGKIEHKGKHDEALSDFKFIMNNSGISEMEKGPSDEITISSEPSSEVKSQALIPPLNSHPQSILFPPDVTYAPISPFIQYMIDRCDNAKQLSMFKTQLSPGEMDNKNIQLAIKNKSVEIKSKK